MSIYDLIAQKEREDRKFGRQEGYDVPEVSVSFNTELEDAIKKVVNDWRKKVLPELKQSASQFKKGKIGSYTNLKTGRTEYKLKDSISSRLKNTKSGELYVSFQFERHGVFRYRGVHKGAPIGNPDSPVDWFNPVIEKHLPELADKIAEIDADASINFGRSKIS